MIGLAERLCRLGTNVYLPNAGPTRVSLAPQCEHRMRASTDAVCFDQQRFWHNIKMFSGFRMATRRQRRQSTRNEYPCREKSAIVSSRFELMACVAQTKQAQQMR